MHATRRLLIASVAALVPAQAFAADWWWVAGDPGSNVALFVDADSVTREGEVVTFISARVERGDEAARETRQTMRCGSNEGDMALRRFACATNEERMHFAAMLGPLTPLYAARAVFEAPAIMPPVNVAGR